MREITIERKLTEAVRAAGGLCPKWISPGTAGVPDRIMLLPGGRIAFAELKAPGKKPRPLQEHRAAQLRRLGFKVYTVDGTEQIEPILKELGGDAL